MSTPRPADGFPGAGRPCPDRAGPGPHAGPERPSRNGRDADRRRWQALAVALVASFMTLLDVSIVNVALPAIRTGLHTTESALQWVVSGYALTFGLALVPAGRLGDARGRRGVFMAGLVMFTAASALVGAAQNEGWLIGARLFQGVAGGVLMPQVSGFIQQLFSGAERGRAFGILGATVGISTAIGPLLGGLLIQGFGAQEGWRWVFYVNLPIGLAALPVACRLLPAPDAGAPAKRRDDLDPLGVTLLGAGTVALLLPFVQGQQWHSAARWLLLPAAAALLAVFAGWERRYRRRGEPLVDMRLFRARSYSLGVLLSLVYFAGFTAIFFIFTLYLQIGLHYSALSAGLSITPFALGSGTAAAIGGRMVNRFGRPLVAVGLVVVVVGLTGAAVAVHYASGAHIGAIAAGPMLLAGIGSGMVISPNQALTLSEVPVARAGSAGGVLQTGQRIGAAAGIAAVGSVFFARTAAHPGDWAGAFQRGVAVADTFVVLALVVALADVLVRRGREAGPKARPEPRP